MDEPIAACFSLCFFPSSGVLPIRRITGSLTDRKAQLCGNLFPLGIRLLNARTQVFHWHGLAQRANRAVFLTSTYPLLTCDRSTRILVLSAVDRVMAPKKKADLLQGTLELLILRMLMAGPANGWDLMHRMQTVSREVIRVTPGSLYPALHRLESRALIMAEWGASENNRKAKFYKITAEGRKALQLEQKTWELFSGAVDLILKEA